FNDEQYTLVSRQDLGDNSYLSTIKVSREESPNQLLHHLIAVTEVHSFVEKIPTMSDIFIKLVGGGDHE
ncbi:MAG TPA: DUF4162 domain-containing protein, partial [Cyclobacteriaceae bacterium]